MAYAKKFSCAYGATLILKQSTFHLFESGRSISLSPNLKNNRSVCSYRNPIFSKFSMLHKSVCLIFFHLSVRLSISQNWKKSKVVTKHMLKLCSNSNLNFKNIHFLDFRWWIFFKFEQNQRVLFDFCPDSMKRADLKFLKIFLSRSS